MTYLGNQELMRLPKTAFLAASTIPPDMVLRCYDWAIEMGRENRCVISGFSSHLEKDVLHFLLKGKASVIFVLARKMYRIIPEELREPLAEGRLLVVSVSHAARQSKVIALARNRFVCEQADRIWMVGVSDVSSLAGLQKEFKGKLVEGG